MFKIFKKYPNLIIGLSKKSDGPMKFSANNRERFFNKLEINRNLTVGASLVHGDKVKFVSKKDVGKLIEETDGLLTKDKKILLTITVADCLPIFIYDPEKEIVGLIHGGWKSLSQNILAKTVKNLSKDILVGIGPGISRCHFEVKQDVLKKFKPYLKDALKDNFLDLKKVAKLQLIDLGIKEENIEINPGCTFCLKDKYFSYRRQKPKKLQTMIAIIAQK